MHRCFKQISKNVQKSSLKLTASVSLFSEQSEAFNSGAKQYCLHVNVVNAQLILVWIFQAIRITKLDDQS